jgi:hypothetical protein
VTTAPYGWCLNCTEWGDPPTPERAHPAAECPWRPSATASQEDLRAFACELLYPGLFADEAYRRHQQQIDRVTAALRSAAMINQQVTR